MWLPQIRIQPPDAENRLSDGVEGHGGQSPRPDRSFEEEAIPPAGGHPLGRSQQRFSTISRTLITLKLDTIFSDAGKFICRIRRWFSEPN